MHLAAIGGQAVESMLVLAVALGSGLGMPGLESDAKPVCCSLLPKMKLVVSNALAPHPHRQAVPVPRPSPLSLPPQLRLKKPLH